MKKLLISLINFYQKKGGGKKLFGIDCNFTQSCSEYTKQALIQYGLYRGVIKGWKRIKMCNDKDSDI